MDFELHCGQNFAKFEIHVRNLTCANMLMQNCANNLQQGAKWNNVNKKSMQ